MNANSFPSSIYQIAGLDDRERGFNRQAPLTASPEGVRLHLRYESVQIVIGPVPTEEQALMGLIQELHGRGYTQLRLQRLFAGDRYLGTQEMWVEYPDPVRPQQLESLWQRWLRKAFGPAEGQ